MSLCNPSCLVTMKSIYEKELCFGIEAYLPDGALCTVLSMEEDGTYTVWVQGNGPKASGIHQDDLDIESRSQEIYHASRTKAVD